MSILSQIDFARSLFFVPDAISTIALLLLIVMVALRHKYTYRFVVYVELPLICLLSICLVLLNTIYVKFIIGVWLLTKLSTISTFRNSVNVSFFLIIGIISSTYLELGQQIYDGFHFTSLFESGNAYILSIFLLSLCLKKKILSESTSIILPLILNSKMFILALLQSRRTIIFSFVCIAVVSVLFSHKVSQFIPRIYFFLDNYGIMYALTSGRLSRILSLDITSTQFIIGAWSIIQPIENYENDIVFPIFNFGVVVGTYLLVLIFVFFYKFRQTNQRNKSNIFGVFLFIGLLMTGHFVGNTIVIFLYAQYYKNHV